MRKKLFSGMVLAALALTLTTAAPAQRRTTASMGGAKHELGVDVGAAYVKPNGASGGIAIQTPFDIRFGILPRSGELMWEPRVTFNFTSTFNTTRYLFTPDVNVLYSTTPGGHRRGMFFTGGAGLVMGDLGGGSGTAFELNAGVGWRKPYGSGAWRYE